MHHLINEINEAVCAAASHRPRRRRDAHCNAASHRPRRRRDDHCNAPQHNITNTEYFAAFYEAQDNNFITTATNDDNHPVVTYTTVEANRRGRRGDYSGANSHHADPVDLTVAMRAEIHYDHFMNERPAISAQVDVQLDAMDRVPGDERGHLLADSLGGPGLPYNFAPQSSMLNRAVRYPGSVVHPPSWWDVEGQIRNFVIRTNGFVRWTLVVGNGDLLETRRPTGFMLTVYYFNADSTLADGCDGEGGAIREYIYLNVPRAACTNRTHNWWKNTHKK